MLTWILDRLFEREDVAHDSTSKYLQRWIIYRDPATRSACYLHRFIGSDPSEWPHDHPKSFLSIGLWGSYIEEVWHPWRKNREAAPTAYQVWVAPWIRRFPAEHCHRIAGPFTKTCWTLVFTGPEQVGVGWYFWVWGEPIPWKAYLEEHGAKS